MSVKDSRLAGWGKPLKIIYRGRQVRYTRTLAEEGDVIELLENNWDDYGSQTTFNTLCRMNDKLFELGSLKLMVQGHTGTSPYLDKLREQGWDGTFPIPATDYISVPSEITFYEQIDSALGPDAAVTAAVVLRDASHLVNNLQDPGAQALTLTSTFKNSLQRERGSVKSYIDGWKIFVRQAMAVLDLGFRFRDVQGGLSTLELKYQTTGPLPHHINVLIGANGAGKSQILHQIVGDWIGDPRHSKETGFLEKPNLSQLVVVSYSPFEMFPVDLDGKHLQDEAAYRYFGLRGRVGGRDPSHPSRVELSSEAPKRSAASSLVDCAADDRRFAGLATWSGKLKTMEAVLNAAFSFDFAAVQVADEGPSEVYDTGIWSPHGVMEIAEGPHSGRWVGIPVGSEATLNIDVLRQNLRSNAGVLFFKDGLPIELSSGQKLFSFIVINILGTIRRESLLLIDEPELFLHPAIEIQFVDMLKSILEQFNSKALIATHSEVTVREVPSACVHVMERTEDGLVVSKPPFQTFGADVQRISSYVFADSSTSKPFEQWITDQLEQYGGAEPLIDALGEDANEELVIQIRAKASSRSAIVW